LRAHTDSLSVHAAREATLTSTDDEIHIQARGRIELASGAARIVLDGPHITFTCPGAFTVHAATHDWGGAVSEPALLPHLPQELLDRPPNALQAQHQYHDEESLQAARFEARLADGSLRRGVTNAAGHLHLADVPPGLVRVRFDADARAFERRDPTPHDRQADLDALMQRHKDRA
jgi:uncharacterized protein (DUF2345 family)